VSRWLSGIVRLLAWLAPRPERDRWREEWLAEIQEITDTRGVRTAARVALGAAPDALAVRRLAAERGRIGSNQRNTFMGISSTDLKLAVRMLVLYPGGQTGTADSSVRQ
jgi:hypothetical protein